MARQALLHAADPGTQRLQRAGTFTAAPGQAVERETLSLRTASIFST